MVLTNSNVYVTINVNVEINLFLQANKKQRSTANDYNTILLFRIIFDAICFFVLFYIYILHLGISFSPHLFANSLLSIPLFTLFSLPFSISLTFSSLSISLRLPLAHSPSLFSRVSVDSMSFRPSLLLILPRDKNPSKNMLSYH